MVAPAAQPALLGLVEELLAEQQRLQTPVTRAGAAYDAPTHGPRFSDLVPLTAPGPGEQYAFQVDLDACSGCKSCVAACHALNGLDDTEAFRDTGVLLGGSPDEPYLQTVTSACHHCAEPGCLEGCPVLAYDKDPLTGIVRHLDDQCIGCQYCILKCPYDVPKYNARLGIVRKCDLCHQRLAHGEAPACAQACPTHAIRVVTVAVASAPERFLAAAPDAAYTRPTTRYVSRREPPAAVRAGDAGLPRPQSAHWPLVVLLTLVPWAVGLQVLGLIDASPGGLARLAPTVLGAAGLGAAGFHLGQPTRAWRVFLGLRRSWFSREAVLLGGWFALSVLALLAPALAPGAAVTGVAGLGCSVMIYADTRRHFWRAAPTAARFFGAGLVCALAVVAPLAAAGLLAAKLAFEVAMTRGTGTSARLLCGPLRGAWRTRQALGLAACAGLVGAAVAPQPWLRAAALALAVAGEFTERLLFFRAVDAPKMPGYPTP